MTVGSIHCVISKQNLPHVVSSAKTTRPPASHFVWKSTVSFARSMKSPPALKSSTGAFASLWPSPGFTNQLVDLPPVMARLPSSPTEEDAAAFLHRAGAGMPGTAGVWARALPNRIRMGSSRMKNIIAGTAGHIDHGKTALVKALTGIDTDRLEEEKRRGISIDLGF